jgi:hypothetical protein
MTDTTLSQALKEAYASAPANTVIYHTLEFRHSAFTQPIRVVKDFVNLTATLESTAPLNPSTAVTFLAFAFDLTKPEVSPNNVPQITISIDNVGREIVSNIEAAITSTELVQVTYREFLSTDLSAPQNNPPLTMTVMAITADVFKLTATAGFPDLMNRKFPTTEYDAQIFAGLLP